MVRNRLFARAALASCSALAVLTLGAASAQTGGHAGEAVVVRHAPPAVAFKQFRAPDGTIKEAEFVDGRFVGVGVVRTARTRGSARFDRDDRGRRYEWVTRHRTERSARYRRGRDYDRGAVRIARHGGRIAVPHGSRHAERPYHNGHRPRG